MALNVLIVDDSQTVRSFIAKTFDLAEIPVGQVFHAANGQEALEALKDNWVDLVLTDINMPVMGGVEMIARMQEDDGLKGIPVVVVSTEGSATRIEQLKEQGVSGYIRKPFTPEKLREVVDGVIGASDAGE
jgi:two-component system chemotaxis response regulator CheY